MTVPDSKEPQFLSSKAIIRFQDCDPYSHLNNGKYLDYFMNAREDQVWKTYDFNIYEYSRTTGLGWVVTQNQIAYIRPALLMEEVTIESQLIDTKPKFLHVEMRMYDAERTLKSLLWAQFIHIDIRKGKSIEHGVELQELFNRVCVPIEEKDFNERLRNMTKKSGNQ
ncbi:MAG: acyl-CoA thioesterase [Saprospiraceae bacterium]